MQFCPYSPEEGREGGGVLRISRDRDDRMGAKIKTQKYPLGVKQIRKNPWTKI